MVNSESNSVIDWPSPSTNVIFTMALSMPCSAELPGWFVTKEMDQVVLGWLAKLGGITRFPTDSSSRDFGSANTSKEVTLLRLVSIESNTRLLDGTWVGAGLDVGEPKEAAMLAVTVEVSLNISSTDSLGREVSLFWLLKVILNEGEGELGLMNGGTL